MENAFVGTRWPFWVVCMAFILLCSNLVLLKEVSYLKKALAQQNLLTRPIPGEHVAAISGVGFDKKPLTMSFEKGGSPALLLLFSPTCSVCALNWPNWGRVISRVHNCSLRIVLLSMSTRDEVTRDYLDKYGVEGLPAFVGVDAGDLARYHFLFTPETILLSGQGDVRKAWLGRLHDDDVDEIVRMISPAGPRQSHFGDIWPSQEEQPQACAD